MQRHLVDVHAGHLLVERVLFAVRDGQVHAGLREEREERGGRERRHLGEQRRAHGVQHAQVIGGVDEHAREVEEAVLDGPTEHQRRDVRSVGAPRDVVRRLVERRHLAGDDDDAVDDVIHGQHVPAVAHVVADGDAPVRVARVE